MKHEIGSKELLDLVVYPKIKRIDAANGGKYPARKLKEFIGRFLHEGFLTSYDSAKEEKVFADTFLQSLTQRGYVIVKDPTK